MPAALAGPLNRVKTLLSTISLGQKIVIGLLLAGLVLGGFMFTRWITAPTMTPLFSNLASADASAIVEELNAEGVSYTLADGGQTIMVANERVYDLRLAMSGKGLPAGNESGYALLDEQGITTSEFQQQVSYQRALEGELANTLKALDGVNAAVVHIALPKDEVFATDEGKPTASVLLDLAPGTSLGGEQVQAVTHLVSSSIEKMDPADVTVADSTGAVLSAAGEGVSGAATDAQSQQEQEYEARLAANAQSILDTVAGPGNAKVSVRADLDFSQRDTTSESYTYNEGTPALSETTTTETYTGTGSAVGGVLGAEDTATTGSGDSSYDKNSTTSNNAVGKTVEVVQGAPGAINRLTVSVVMDDASAGALNQQQIQALVGNAVGLDVARGDAITVASMAFDTTAAEQAAAELKAAEEAEKTAQMWSMIKTGGIALGIALLVLIVWLRSRRGREEYEELEDDEPVEYERIQVESVRDPELDDRQAKLESAKRERVRGEISEMVSERPDEVATMLRGWFAESK
ncbi:flagellar basal-body MS-ring/collar protein FliF [Modestobacter versicolor]|uniref:Flagellar M-ring protein n=1 Tax=Modestobacter versicolor TaxID=429133 RepID=A0A323VA64_9ACTN|nr:flagellar basal-body MS-ring/collar protein FliF [Modestobacter versicolor]MBB3676513.1 flagellar M-ring protein FliF [Modestobacter versicolor]PZA21664.1 flagellar M-ring protein FliF [Modestobacter versicolor]